MTAAIDEGILDDAAALEAGDRGAMLRAVATAGAQVREAARLAREAGVGRLADDGRPRAVVVAGVGTAAIAGEMLRAVTGLASPSPVITERGFALPGWLGPLDLVVAVSCSGRTEETLALVEEAARRGCRLLTVGAPRSPLAAVAEQARAPHVPVLAAGRPTRANLWAMAVPLLVAADALGLESVTEEVLSGAADRLDRIAERCGPTVDTVDNAAKALAIELSGGLPVVWGSGDVGGVGAQRFASQLAANAKVPAPWSALPDAAYDAIVALDGPYGGGSRDDDDFFRDRVAAPEEPLRMRVVLVRDTVEHPRVAARRRALRAVTESRDIVVRELTADGEHPVERLATLIGTGDFASIYLALGAGVDPTSTPATDQLKERISR